MRIAICSDEPYPVNDLVRSLCEARGHSVVAVRRAGHRQGDALGRSGRAGGAQRGGRRVRRGHLLLLVGHRHQHGGEQGRGRARRAVRDPGAARAARVWNHANVLCLSNRTLSTDMAKEILEAWFETEPGTQGSAGVERLDRRRSPAPQARLKNCR